MIRVLIFDLDGTVADTIHAVLEAFNRMLTGRGYPAVGMEQFLDYFSGSAAEYARHGMKDLTDEKILAEATAALAIARELGAEPGECAFIGDSEIDLYTARNAGMVPVIVTWGYRTEGFLAALGAPGLLRTPEALVSYLLENRLTLKPAERRSIQ